MEEEGPAPSPPTLQKFLSKHTVEKGRNLGTTEIQEPEAECCTASSPTYIGSKYALLGYSIAQKNPPQLAEIPGSRVSYTGSTFWPSLFESLSPRGAQQELSHCTSLRAAPGDQSLARSLLGSLRLHVEQKQASNEQVFLRKGTRASQTQKGLWIVTQVETHSKQSPPLPHKAQPRGI